MKTLYSIWKFFIGLNSEKQLIGILFGVILFLGFYFFTKDSLNQKALIELKLAYKNRLDTCEVTSVRLQRELSYWKDSLASEKLKNALIEIDNIKKIAESTKKSENNVLSYSKNIKNKQNKILKTLKHEK